MPVPTVENVDAIAAIPDAAARNYRMTDTYYELSTAFAASLEGSANWCTFATWASKQAGCSIRGEDVAQKFRQRINANSAIRLIWERLLAQIGLSREEAALRIGEAMLQLTGPRRTAAAIGRGNQKVFAEIGREFARFLALPCSDGIPAEETVNRFCAELRGGDPPDGQRLLQEAFLNYFRAVSTSDPKACAEATFLANIQIGVHEQTRLQPEIQEAMNSAVADGKEAQEAIVGLIMRKAADPILAKVRARAAERLSKLVASEALLAWRMAVTEHLMSLEFGNQVVVRLGQDVQRGFPALLLSLQDAALVAFLAQVDPTRNSTRDSGALDWADLRDRMHLITDLFRAFQQEPVLMLPPFSAEATRHE